MFLNYSHISVSTSISASLTMSSTTFKWRGTFGYLNGTSYVIGSGYQPTVSACATVCDADLTCAIFEFSPAANCKKYLSISLLAWNGDFVPDSGSVIYSRVFMPDHKGESLH